MKFKSLGGSENPPLIPAYTPRLKHAGTGFTGMTASRRFIFTPI